MLPADGKSSVNRRWRQWVGRLVPEHSNTKCTATHTHKHTHLLLPVMSSLRAYASLCACNHSLVKENRRNYLQHQFQSYNHMHTHTLLFVLELVGFIVMKQKFHSSTSQHLLVVKLRANSYKGFGECLEGGRPPLSQDFSLLINLSATHRNNTS